MARRDPLVWTATVTAMIALRAALGVLCGVATAALGALILGEYEFTGSLPFAAGPLLGLAIGEVTVGVGRVRTVPMAVVAAALGFGAITWAGWISSGEGLEPIKPLVWVAAVLAAVTAGVRTARLHRPAKT